MRPVGCPARRSLPVLPGILALILLWGCSVAPPPGFSPSEATLLRITTQPDSITLCEATQKRVAVGVSWAGSGSPAVSALPKLTWRSEHPEVVAVDSTGAITGVRPGEGRIVVLGTVDEAYGRAVLPVRVLPRRLTAGSRDGRAIPGCD